MIDYILLAAACYLIGAIPFGYIVGKAQGIDVRRHGSGRTGATNALRTLGTRSSALVFVGDLAKGVLVVLLARYFLKSPTAEAIAALSAMVGHNWSIYIGFSGGRGVTISFGSMLTMSTPIALVGLAIFVAVIRISKYVSLGSLLGVCSIPIVTVFFLWFGLVPVEYLVYSLIGAPVVVFAHRDNIDRLRTGRERRLDRKAEAGET